MDCGCGGGGGGWHTMELLAPLATTRWLSGATANQVVGWLAGWLGVVAVNRRLSSAAWLAGWPVGPPQQKEPLGLTGLVRLTGWLAGAVAARSRDAQRD